MDILYVTTSTLFIHLLFRFGSKHTMTYVMFHLYNHDFYADLEVLIPVTRSL